MHRADDTRKALTKRMTAYHESTTPILDYYYDRGILSTLNATAKIEDVASQIKFALQGQDQ